MSRRSWLATEWGTLIRSRTILISLIGIVLIPVLYSGVYLWAFWDPYGHIERLSVAVVNEDQPAVFEGETFRIGEELVDQFKADRSFDWHFVTRAEAEQGLANQSYYFGLFIPADFSKRATTLMAQQPTPLEITIKSNEGLNFIVAKIGQSGVEKIRQKLSEKLTLNYTEIMFGTIDKLRDGMQQASEGASNLNAGIGSLLSGTNELASTLGKRSSSIAKLDKGASDLKAAAMQLASGADQLNAGFGKLATGTKQIREGLTSAAAGSRKLSDALVPLIAGAAQTDRLIAAYAADHSDTAKDKSYQALTEANKKISAGLAHVGTSLTALNTGIAQLSDKQAELLAGMDTFAPSLEQLSSGAKQLANGADALYTGVYQLGASWNALIKGIGELSEGELRLFNGSAELASRLADSANKLANVHSSQSLFEMMANPVRLKEETFHSLPNYGTGMAPFFVSISLYVGSLLLTTVFALRELANPAPSGFMWFLSKYGIMSLVALGQALLVAYVLTGVVGIEPLNMLYFAGFTLFVSLVFMAIIQLLVTLGDNVGRFIAIILLVLQLAATSGTFPVELGPPGLQTIHGFLPITYTVEGFRAILSTGDYALLQRDCWLLLIYWGGAVALTILVLSAAVRKRRRNFGERAV
ncbi:MAG: YhgE/Pip domain-containing protein [Cohnella sp.]|nr:YhgE/Pip domain-containing protein [Cohnella sp.]